jgi:predicted xylose isomerase-like sugar epimerase
MAASDIIAWIDRHLVWNEEQIEEAGGLVASLEGGAHRTFVRGPMGETDTTGDSLEKARATVKALREGSDIMQQTRRELLMEGGEP